MWFWRSQQTEGLGGGRTGERVTVAERRKHFEDEGQFPGWIGAVDWLRHSEGHSGLASSHFSVLR